MLPDFNTPGLTTATRPVDVEVVASRRGWLPGRLTWLLADVIAKQVFADAGARYPGWIGLRQADKDRFLESARRARASVDADALYAAVERAVIAGAETLLTAVRQAEPCDMDREWCETVVRDVVGRVWNETGKAGV